MNDYISRQAAIDLVTDMEFMNNTAKGILRDRLRKLSSAQPEPLTINISNLTKEELEKLRKDMADAPVVLLPERKTGKWKRKIVDSGFNADWICSECGYRLKTEYATNFCPNCGADMRGDSDEIN